MPPPATTGQLFIVSAPSGVGKSTIIRRVIASSPNLKFSISCTTRPIRSGEVDGKDYHFLSIEEFLSGINSGRFLEWAEVYGHLYGTDRRLIEKWLKAGNDVLLDIDVQGARLVHCAYPAAQTIFFLPPSMHVLQERLRNRATETEEQMVIRVAAARRELPREGRLLHQRRAAHSEHSARHEPQGRMRRLGGDVEQPAPLS